MTTNQNKDIEEQIEELANFLMKNYDSEMGMSGKPDGEGAVEMAIRLLSKPTVQEYKKKLLAKLLEQGHGGGNWRRLITKLINEN